MKVCFPLFHFLCGMWRNHNSGLGLAHNVFNYGWSCVLVQFHAFDTMWHLYTLYGPCTMVVWWFSLLCRLIDSLGENTVRSPKIVITNIFLYISKFCEMHFYKWNYFCEFWRVLISLENKIKWWRLKNIWVYLSQT